MTVGIPTIFFSLVVNRKNCFFPVDSRKKILITSKEKISLQRNFLFPVDSTEESFISSQPPKTRNEILVHPILLLYILRTDQHTQLT